MLRTVPPQNNLSVNINYYTLLLSGTNAGHKPVCSMVSSVEEREWSKWGNEETEGEGGRKA